MKTFFLFVFFAFVASFNGYSQCQPILHYTGCNIEVVGGPGLYVAYQWYFKKEPIPEAYEFFYTPEETGVYTVIAFTADGCYGYARMFTVGWCGVE